MRATEGSQFGRVFSNEFVAISRNLCKIVFSTWSQRQNQVRHIVKGKNPALIRVPEKFLKL